MKRVATLILLLSLTGGLGAHDVPVTEAPKQSPYVIFIEVCRVLDFIYITSEPPMALQRGQVASERFLEILRNTPPERVIRLTHWDSFCPKTERT